MTEPFVCTKDHPWDRTQTVKGQRVSHPDAEYVDDRDYGLGEYCVKYHCPHCGKSFEVELPQ